jgi:hypothetical protein
MIRYSEISNEFGDFVKMIDLNENVFWIPKNEENADYRAYLAWLAEGNEPEVIE